MLAGDAGMLRLRASSLVLPVRFAHREWWACWNLLTRFGYLWCIIGGESNHFAVMSWV